MNENSIILEIKNDMESWYGIKLTTVQVEEYLKETPIQYFDTVEREDYSDYLGLKITGMRFPMNGDNQEYKDKFKQAIRDNAEKFGYDWKV